MIVAQIARTARRSLPFYITLGAVMVIFLFPFYWGLITSLKFEVEIYDFSGKNEWTENMRQFYDPGHVRPHIGDKLLATLYASGRSPSGAPSIKASMAR